MESVVLSDFGLGEWQHPNMDIAAPRGAVSTLRNGHVDGSGILRARGPVRKKFSAAFGTGIDPDYGERFLWSGTLLPGQRAAIYSKGTGTNGRLQPFNAAQTNYVTGAVAFLTSVDTFTVVGNMLFLGTRYNGSATAITAWGGSLLGDYTGLTGMTRTAGSRVVTRAAGGFTTGVGVDVGMMIGGWDSPGMSVIGGGKGFAVVQSVDSDTQLTMDRESAFTESVTTSLYEFIAAGSATGLPSFGQGIPGSIAGRLLVMQNNRLYFSRGPDPTTGRPRTGQFQAGDVHEFPSDAVGIALPTLRDRVFCFTEAGLYTVSGMAYEIVDGSGNPQHAIEEVTSKSIAISGKGIVKWQGALVVPCRDGIYAMDGYGAPVLLSRGLPWAEWVRDGLQVGWGTVFKGRYLLPVLYQGEYKTIVLRMDGVDTATQGTVFPAATFTPPNGVYAYATTPNADSLLAAGKRTDGVLEAGQIFSQVSPVDHDGNTPLESLVLEAGPVVLPPKSVIRRVRVRRTYLQGFAGVPTMTVTVINGREGSGWERSVSGTVEIDQNIGAAQWQAIELSAALEVDSSVTVKLEVSMDTLGSGPSDFVVHAIEILYRSFGGV